MQNVRIGDRVASSSQPPGEHHTLDDATWMHGGLPNVKRLFASALWHPFFEPLKVQWQLPVYGSSPYRPFLPCPTLKCLFSFDASRWRRSCLQLRHTSDQTISFWQPLVTSWAFRLEARFEGCVLRPRRPPPQL